MKITHFRLQYGSCYVEYSTFQVPLLTSGPCIVMALNYYMSLVMFNITLSDTTSYVWSLYYDGFKLLYEMSFMLIKLFQVPLLTSGPCIVMALQRDNAVLVFDSIMGR